MDFFGRAELEFACPIRTYQIHLIFRRELDSSLRTPGILAPQLAPCKTPITGVLHFWGIISSDLLSYLLVRPLTQGPSFYASWIKTLSLRSIALLIMSAVPLLYPSHTTIKASAYSAIS